MSDKVTFILGMHNHQPVGNFEHVIEEAYKKAYLPFLEVMKEHPAVSFALHNSGILWDWFMEKHPKYMELLKGMIDSDQVELMSGGYYEPILTVIPERDRQGQLKMMRQFLLDKFRKEPAGCWLTERIWDPHLPETLYDAGLNYVVVDDSHFKSTGFTSEEMRGYFSTEENGKFINVFPIDMKLRYLIPFHQPQEAIDYFHKIAEEDTGSSKIVVLADDGEKFGLWPGTNNLCYRQKWLHRFCEALEKNSEWLEISTFSEVLNKFRAEGMVYLPTASYNEMMEWALPLRAQEKYQGAKETLENNGFGEEAAELLKGGLWRNFMVKYEESNWMHKRMLLTSDMVEACRSESGKDGGFENARDHLYQAQCNCAYWHGLFGGLYLPHLRSAIYKNLISAEVKVKEHLKEKPAAVPGGITDMDGDGTGEVILTGDNLRAYVKLKGGTLRELDLFDPPFNLTDTLTRRREMYHRNVGESGQGGDIDEAVSIHNVKRSKQSNLDKLLIYDQYPRASFMDHFIDRSVNLKSFSSSDYRELGDFTDGVYRVWDEKGEGDSISLWRDGEVVREGDSSKVKLFKKYSLMKDRSAMSVEYRVVVLEGKLDCMLGVETVFSFLAGDAPDRYYRFPGRKVNHVHLASRGEEKDVKSFSLVDEWMDISLDFSLDPPARLWRFPLFTVSNSETGFEKVYQGSVISPLWHLNLGRGEESVFSVIIEAGPAKE